MKYTKMCKFCGVTFETSKHDKDFCNANHKKQYITKQNPPKTTTKECVVCGSLFETYKKQALTCSRTCIQQLSNDKIRADKKKENDEKYKHIPDIPTCKICGWKSRSLTTHLRLHKLTVDQYKKQYGLTDNEVHHSSYQHEKSNRIRGSLNPGYNHGGKMSSFSPNFTKYNGLAELDIQSRIQTQIDKANATKKTNNNYNTTVDYYIKQGMSEHDATLALIGRQTTFSRKKCIEKYGYAEGIKKWKDRQAKWKKTLDELPDEVKHRIALDKSKGFRQLDGSKYSKMSQQLFNMLSSFSDKYGENEECVILTNYNTFYFPDFLCEDKIIEFNGDYWHANPKLFNSSAVLKFPGTDNYKTAQSLWDKDKIRTERLEMLGYQILVVWESEYKQDKLGTIKKCIDFLNN